MKFTVVKNELPGNIQQNVNIVGDIVTKVFTFLMNEYHYDAH